MRGAEGDSTSPPAVRDTLVYVGTYTGPKSQGIYLFKVETRNPEVSQNILLLPLGLAAETPNPSFLAIDQKRRLVFAVNEIADFEGQSAGSVTSFRIDPQTGKLVELSRKSSRGAGACHIALSPEGKHVVVANYDGGSIAVLPVDDEGKLGDATDFVQFAGHGPNAERQDAPHAHCATFDPAGKFVFVCDLGTDQVLGYRYDAEAGKLKPTEPAATALAPGAGPRHMAFHPSGKFAYVINELNSTITAFAYDAATGSLKELQSVSTLPGYFDGPNTTAEIAVHPSGQFLYASNRGHESVVLFEINRDDGTLTYVEEQGTGGKTPRNFAIQPNAEHLVIANQNSDTLLICRVDKDNGRLKPSGVFAEAPSPVCVAFLPPRRGDR